MFIFISCVLGAQKNGLKETVLLSTHNIWFVGEIRKLISNLYTLVWRSVFMYSKSSKVSNS